MNNHFTPKAQNALRKAKTVAEQLGHTYVGSEHLLIGLLEEEGSVAKHFLESRGLTQSRLLAFAQETDGTGIPSRAHAATMTPRVKHILENAKTDAEKSASGLIGTEHLLSALLEEDDAVAVMLLRKMGYNVSDMRSDLGMMIDALPVEDEKKKKASSSSLLSAYSRDLTAFAAAGKLDPVIGRDAETERVIRILCRRQKNNPCLIGDPGVGKTAVVEGLAQRIIRKEVPDLLIGQSIFALDLSSLIAGAKYRGEFEERLRGVMSEISKRSDLILFIDEIHTIVGAGAAEGAMDAANILKPILSRGESKIIGATTEEEYRKYIEKDHALERRFQPIRVEEPDDMSTYTILSGLRDRYEKHHKLRIEDEALKAAVRLSRRYLPDRRMPDKAIDLIDEAASSLRVKENMQPKELQEMEREWQEASLDKENAIRSQNFEQAAASRDREKEASDSYYKMRQEWERRKSAFSNTVTVRDICEIVQEMTGIPPEMQQTNEEERLRGILPFLESKVLGQTEAASALASAILRSRLGLRDPHRPLGTFLFTGPTGVGKTEMAKALAEFLFGTPNALLRFDMSEYMERHSVSRLIGSPPGYVGFEEGGLLTDAIRKKPYSVILFDEIEKAHPDITGLLLQITEEGTLTDSQGRKADFCNAVIILTSNITENELHHATGFLAQNDEKQLRESALGQFFRPELLHRMDEIIIFSLLPPAVLRQIARKFADESTKRAAEEGYRIHFPDETLETLLTTAEKEGGARSLRHMIRRHLTDELARAIANGTVLRGKDYAGIVENGAIRFVPSSSETKQSAK